MVIRYDLKIIPFCYMITPMSSLIPSYHSCCMDRA
jgi:hypothetical protein